MKKFAEYISSDAKGLRGEILKVNKMTRKKLLAYSSKKGSPTSAMLDNSTQQQMSMYKSFQNNAKITDSATSLEKKAMASTVPLKINTLNMLRQSQEENYSKSPSMSAF